MDEAKTWMRKNKPLMRNYSSRKGGYPAILFSCFYFSLFAANGNVTLYFRCTYYSRVGFLSCRATATLSLDSNSRKIHLKEKDEHLHSFIPGSKLGRLQPDVKSMILESVTSRTEPKAVLTILKSNNSLLVMPTMKQINNAYFRCRRDFVSSRYRVKRVFFVYGLALVLFLVTCLVLIFDVLIIW